MLNMKYRIKKVICYKGGREHYSYFVAQYSRLGLLWSNIFGSSFCRSEESARKGIEEDRLDDNKEYKTEVINVK